MKKVFGGFVERPRYDQTLFASAALLIGYILPGDPLRKEYNPKKMI